MYVCVGMIISTRGPRHLETVRGSIVPLGLAVVLLLATFESWRPAGSGPRHLEVHWRHQKAPKVVPLFAPASRIARGRSGRQAQTTSTILDYWYLYQGTQRSQPWCLAASKHMVGWYLNLE